MLFNNKNKFNMPNSQKLNIIPNSLESEMISNFKKEVNAKYHGFNFKIHPMDEMYKNRVQKLKRKKIEDYEHQAWKDYFKIGENIINRIADILYVSNRKLSSINSVMDFAAGYGRVSRFLPYFLDQNGEISISEIDHKAVDFQINEFNFNGYYSYESSKDFECDKTYDLVYCISLFTHLNEVHFPLWLERISELLNKNGLLLITTHGLHKRPSKDYWNIMKNNNGFDFNLVNETNGRLKLEYYGGAFVSYNYIKKIVDKIPGIDILNFIQFGIANHDVYLICKSS